MSTAFDIVTFDSPSPDRAAAFWSGALSLHEIEREDGDRWIVLADREGVRRIGLQRGTVQPGTVHLDLRCDVAEFDDELDRLATLGARVVGSARNEAYGRIANLSDPDGNLFDLCCYR